MSYYELTVVQSKKMLGNLEAWLDKGVAFAKEKGIDTNVLLGTRLYPNQFSLLRQVQSCCDWAKFPASRLTGKEPPKHADGDQTIEELKKRIQSVKEYLDTFTEADFKDAEKREVKLGFLEGKLLYGSDYVTEMGLPNYYFHLVTAYSILRSVGVELGKQDYLGSLKMH